MVITKTFKGAKIEISTEVVTTIRVDGKLHRQVYSIPELKQALRSLAWTLSKEAKKRSA